VNRAKTCHGFCAPAAEPDQQSKAVREQRAPDQLAETTEVAPYPVGHSSQYHDGKPDQPRKDSWGSVTGFIRPGSIDFRHTIMVTQLRATVDVHIHYSFEWTDGQTSVSRWLVLDIAMPTIVRAFRNLITSRFDRGERPDDGRGEGICRVAGCTSRSPGQFE
jgi:hypothetical protein